MVWLLRWLDRNYHYCWWAANHYLWDLCTILEIAGSSTNIMFQCFCKILQKFVSRIVESTIFSIQLQTAMNRRHIKESSSSSIRRRRWNRNKDNKRKHYYIKLTSIIIIISSHNLDGCCVFALLKHLIR